MNPRLEALHACACVRILLVPQPCQCVAAAERMRDFLRVRAAAVPNLLA